MPWCVPDQAATRAAVHSRHLGEKLLNPPIDRTAARAKRPRHLWRVRAQSLGREETVDRDTLTTTTNV
jgi:hypothetical protein